ncbi:uncharacterized protein B0H18DRAFT_1037980 [Fomitopsis serialis]|uniref:uncharacterized protein n=1 Tax=Fomitopsis serialis TaxID=139415 RepID=UPI0020080FA8|nr:uncharacterized protein B0H18DRAFT_1047724 [Neoantrodia serialis]XP_047887826.1 uncharacterized protein B0H18DRAFT_1037980 [Neoantrodia serialis]KAH9913708.1 hypothetical protein B0H18DRAFT_1047724 [Neoantrodia serialis]KAH9916663.1 hypothetical protein B0H18DRAFT_1037980 [Neoantrodia serialis]
MICISCAGECILLSSCAGHIDAECSHRSLAVSHDFRDVLLFHPLSCVLAVGLDGVVSA